MDVEDLNFERREATEISTETATNVTIGTQAMMEQVVKVMIIDKQEEEEEEQEVVEEEHEELVANTEDVAAETEILNVLMHNQHKQQVAHFVTVHLECSLINACFLHRTTRHACTCC